jgi:hypothetical protein
VCYIYKRVKCQIPPWNFKIRQIPPLKFRNRKIAPWNYKTSIKYLIRPLTPSILMTWTLINNNTQYSFNSKKIYHNLSKIQKSKSPNWSKTLIYSPLVSPWLCFWVQFLGFVVPDFAQYWFFMCFWSFTGGCHMLS